MITQEPSADTRSAAHEIRQMFLAFTQAGFTEDQALDLVIALLPPRKEK